MRLALRLASAAVLVKLATASIYPTEPVAVTTFSAGHMNTISWIEDGNPPLTEDMRSVRIDLYVDRETFVATLADAVDPTASALSVWISPSWNHNGSDYHIRFVCEQPPITIYTADFTITGMATILPSGAPNLKHHQNGTTPNKVHNATTHPTLSLPNITAATSLLSTSARVTSTRTSSSTTSSATSTTSSLTLSLIDPLATPSGGASNNGLIGHHTNDALAGIWKRPTADMERLKFRFVFVFWPMLMGIAMAL